MTARQNKGEALGVVGIVAGASSVKLLAVKEFGAIDEVELHAVAPAAVYDADEAVVVLEGDGDGGDGVGDFAGDVRTDARVERQIDGNVVAELCQLRRERADHVGEAAGLGERHALGGGKNDLHWTNTRNFSFETA